jgi:hypothetical protein
MSDWSPMQFVDSLTAFVRINRLAVSTVSTARCVSLAREYKLRADILEQLAHSVRREHCVSRGNQRGTRTPFIFVGYFIGMSSLLGGLRQFLVQVAR